MGDRVTVFEVGPRDGLQNEATTIPTAEKVRLVDLLSECGFAKIEVTSFVSPKWVPQMADGPEVMSRIVRRAGTSYAALTPNQRGLDGALAAKADEIAVFASASEGFSQANINCSIAESLERFRPVAQAAQAAGVPMRGYVSCVIDCPFDGPTPPRSVAQVARRLMDIGCYEVSLGDTIGKGTPPRVSKMLHVATDAVSSGDLAGHFHDTNGMALENVEAALEFGLRTFDAAVGGLGGCPYAPGASGNVATEDVVARLEKLGFDTGIDQAALARASEFARSLRTL